MVALVMLTFFVISLLTNIIGPIVPDIIQSFELSLTLVALLPFAFFIAYGVMSIPAGMLVERYREKPVMIAAFVLAFLGALLFASLPRYPTALLSLFLIGAGDGRAPGGHQPPAPRRRRRGALRLQLRPGPAYLRRGLVP